MSALFLPECFTETLLYSFLLYDQKRFYTHKHSINKVLADMGRIGGPYHTLIGCIDKDKKIEFKYFLDFQLVEAKFDISVLSDKNNENRILLQLEPAAEAWLLETSKLAGIDPKKFGLPDTPKELKVFSTESVLQNQVILKTFIKELFSTNHERCEFLRGIVQRYVPKPDWVQE